MLINNIIYMSPITGDTASLKKAKKSILDWSKDDADLKGAISRISVIYFNVYCRKIKLKNNKRIFRINTREISWR